MTLYMEPDDLPSCEDESQGMTDEQSLFAFDPDIAEYWADFVAMEQERREREARMHFAELQDEERGNYWNEI